MAMNKLTTADHGKNMTAEVSKLDIMVNAFEQPPVQQRAG
jgi:hypothetical protein